MADTVCIGAAFVTACAANLGLVGSFSKLRSGEGGYLPILASSIIAWWMIYRELQLDGSWRGWQWGKLFSELAVGLGVLAGVLAAVAFLTHDFIPRSILLGFVVLLGIGFTLNRAMLHLFLSSTRSRPNRRAVIVGNGKIAEELCFKLQHHPEMRCEVVGFLYPTEVARVGCPTQRGFRCVGSAGDEDGLRTVQDLGTIALLRERAVTDVILALSDERMARSALDLAARCREAGLRVNMVPRSYELYAARTSLMDFDGLPLLSVDKVNANGLSEVSKRTFDLTFLALSLPVALPLLLFAIAYIKVRRGVALRKESRCGRHGDPFFMYRLNLERGASRGVVERMLTELSITELPQLWNVLLGDMTMVGPRPESPGRVSHYSEWQRQRLRVRPGITGLAQVHGLREESSTEDKARFDLQYMLSSGAFSDAVLVVETLWTLLGRLLAPKRGAFNALLREAPGAIGGGRQC
jgi:lipopolysaccharide/colanic/teichoic acid biosynthesis glycosyltransferase